MLKPVFLIWGFFSLIAFCDFGVTFMEVRNSHGELVVLEPDFKYAHVVIDLDRKFLHAHPQTGVTWLNESEITEFGVLKERILIKSEADIEGTVKNWLGRPYDSQFSWDDDKFYCSELVAKILGISPEPMHFDPSLWPPKFKELEGELGISPGKIYRKIKEQDFSFE